jgi:phage-related protein
MMGASCFPERSIDSQQAIWRYIAEDCTFQKPMLIPKAFIADTSELAKPHEHASMVFHQQGR